MLKTHLGKQKYKFKQRIFNKNFNNKGRFVFNEEQHKKKKNFYPSTHHRERKVIFCGVRLETVRNKYPVGI